MATVKIFFALFFLVVSFNGLAQTFVENPGDGRINLDSQENDINSFRLEQDFMVRPASTQQEVDHSYKPLTLKLTDDGSKYIRFIVWHQQWFQTNNLAIEDSKFQVNSFVRRSRFLAYAQISPRFLILTHFGLNNLTADNLTCLGNTGDGAQLFLHGAWAEFKVTNNDALYVGGGLHYWNGLTRLASQSTLNFMTMDNTRPFVQWHSLGITDQFGRHMGLYAKGKFGKLDYRIAVNNPLNPANAIRGGANAPVVDNASDLTYTGSITANDDGDPTGNTIVQGYFRYNLWDAESIKLPYIVGTYFGKKKVLAIGAGFFAHPNGMYNNVTAEHENVMHLAGDIYLDMPVGDGNGLNAYASFINFNYGDNYMARWAGTGTNLYAQVGYYLGGARFMPYVAFQTGNYGAYDDNLNAMNIGLNYHLNGHNAKITLEYHSVMNNPSEGGVDLNGDPNGVQQIRMQFHIFL